MINENPLLARIIDFGTCKDLTTDCGPHTSYVSTRWYRAPECALRSHYYTWASDIFAAGCIMAITIDKDGKLQSLICVDPLCEVRTAKAPPPSGRPHHRAPRHLSLAGPARARSRSFGQHPLAGPRVVCSPSLSGGSSASDVRARLTVRAVDVRAPGAAPWMPVA
jgi:serine/threonine protein kinase